MMQQLMEAGLRRNPDLVEAAKGLVFRTEYPVDEKTIADKLKKAATVVDVVKRHRAEEQRAKGIAAS